MAKVFKDSDGNVVTLNGQAINYEAGTDVSDTTAVASDVLSGKDFYLADGTKTTGIIESMAGGTKTTNTTLATANKYLTSDITIGINPAAHIYRHLNPTIIRITTTSANEEITIKIGQGSNGVTCYMSWGDGSGRVQISSSTTTQTKTHTYSVAGTYNIVFAPDAIGNNRFLLNSVGENKDLLTFATLMFGQSSGSHFINKVSIYCGDSTWFKNDALRYCDNIEVLDFTNMNSLLETDTGYSPAYYTQDYLSDNLARESNIDTLILGSGINELKNYCFYNTTVRDIIIKDVRSTGISTAAINARSDSLPTITGHIYIKSVRASTYRNATNWSSKSSQFVNY